MRAVDKSRQSRQQQCTCAHGAGFHRCIESRAFKPPIAQCARRRSERQDLGMSCRVLQRFHAVEAASDDHALVDYDAADRHLVSGEGFLSLLQSLVHEPLIEFYFGRPWFSHTMLFMRIMIKNQTDYSGCSHAFRLIYKLLVRWISLTGAGM